MKELLANRPRLGQSGINMVDLMMWLVIAALLLASAIQGIAYYQQSAYVYQLKSAIDVASSRVMALATNDGSVDVEDIDTVVEEENAKTPDDGITLTVETLSYAASAPQDSFSIIERASFSTPMTVVPEGETAYIRASHEGATKNDVIYFFEDTASKKVGMHVVGKGGTSSGNGNGSGTGGSETTEPEAPVDTDGDGTPDSEDSTPNGPDADGDGIPDTTDPDIDGDGIPNAEDPDADGDGVPDDYVAGGPVTEADGTAYPYKGEFRSSMISNAGNSVYAVFHSPADTQAHRVAAHFIATCARTDGTTFEVNGINGFNSATTAVTQGVTFSNCGANKVIKYVIKPLTKEAMASGEISNPDFAGGYTFSGGYKWSEFDGHAVSANIEAWVTTDARTLSIGFQYQNHPEVRRLAGHLKYTCVRPDKSTYTGNSLTITNSVANQTGTYWIHQGICSTGDVISDFSIAPVKSLREVSNPDAFGGYTIGNTVTWKESVDGYRTNAALVDSYVSTGGHTISMGFSFDNMPSAQRVAFGLKYTCVRTDKTTYSGNIIQFFNTVANGTSYWMHPRICSDYNKEVLSEYEISPITNMREMNTPVGFGGYTITGGEKWVEATDGYMIGGTVNSATINSTRTSIHVVMNVNAGFENRRFAYQSDLTCVNSAGTTYNVSKMGIYNSAAAGTYTGTVNCGTDKITSYKVGPIHNLRAVPDPSGFGGVTLSGVHTG